MSEYEAGAELPAEELAAVEALEQGIEESAPVIEDKPEFTPTPEYDVEAASAEKEEAAKAEKAEADKPDAETLAKRMGWAPKENWRGKEDQWVGAQEFLDRANPAMLMERLSKMESSHQKTVQSMERMNKAALERQKAELTAKRDELEAQYVARGDAQAVRELNQNYDRISAELDAGQHQAPQQQQVQRAPEVDSWIEQRPQFKTDPMFYDAADKMMTAIEAQMPGKSVSEHLAELDKRLAPRFPDIYQQAKASEAPPAGARQMDGVKVSTKKSSNYASRIPAEAKAQGERFVKDGLFKNIEEFAKEYVNG